MIDFISKLEIQYTVYLKEKEGRGEEMRKKEGKERNRRKKEGRGGNMRKYAAK